MFLPHTGYPRSNPSPEWWALAGQPSFVPWSANNVTPPLQIWLLGDGKPGHENQSAGLAEALGRIVPADIRSIPTPGKCHIIARVHAITRATRSWHKPDLLIGAGHSTHLPLLWLARQHGVPCVVLMKPSLPTALFDLCLVPAHDLGHSIPPPRVIPTLGALNRVPPPANRERTSGLILVGGPSTTHGWDQDAMLDTIGVIISRSRHLPWHITDSRRTPEGFMPLAAQRFANVSLHPHQQTGRDWLPAQLAAAAEVWVTEDSISMIYEALSSGARVGLIPVPRLKRDGRVSRGVDHLADEGFVTRFSRWQTTGTLSSPPRVLREADRCAEEVARRLFPDMFSR